MYILKRLCASIGVLAAILVVLLWLTQSLKFIEVIVHHNVSLAGYLSLIVFLLPDLFVKVAPVCTLIGAIIAFSKLTLDNELQVMQALGKSPWQILRPGMALASSLTIGLILLNVFIIPNSFRAFRLQEFQLRNQFSSSIVREGSFNMVRGLTIFVEKRKSAREFEGVFIHDNGEHGQKPRKPYTLLAKEGILKKINDQYVLVLYHGVRQEKDKENTVQSFEFEELVYNINEITSLANSRNMKPYEKDLKELFQISGPKPENQKLQNRLEAEGHQRILLPFLCLLNILLVALVMVVNRPSRRMRRRRMVYLILSGILFQWLILNLLQLQMKFSFAIPCAYALVVALITTGIIILRKGSAHHPLQRLFERCGI
jgi:lipopolysaccharide export system permease protein